MKSFGNGFEELLVNGFLAIIMIDGMIILGDWFYYIPNEINERVMISIVSIFAVLLLIVIIVYSNRLDKETSKQHVQSLNGDK